MKSLVPATSHWLVRLTEDHIASLSLEHLDELEDHLKSVIHDRRLERRRAINDNAPLVKLPTEILLEIGRLLLGDSYTYNFILPEKGPDVPIRATFKRVLPFLQTCNRLRAKLHLVRYERLLIQCLAGPHEPHSFYQINDLRVLAWRLRNCASSDIHRGPIAVLLDLGFRNYFNFSPSTAAALAGYVECLSYGRLQNPPVVYIKTDHIRHFAYNWCDEWFTSHLRERGIIRFRRIGLFNEFVRTLGTDESKRLWDFLTKEANEFKWWSCRERNCTRSVGTEGVEDTLMPVTADCWMQVLMERLL